MLFVTFNFGKKHLPSKLLIFSITSKYFEIYIFSISGNPDCSLYIDEVYLCYRGARQNIFGVRYVMELMSLRHCKIGYHFFS